MNLNRSLIILTIVLLLSFSSILAQQEKIIYSSSRAGTKDIWMCNPDGTNHERLTNKPGKEHCARLSPDGTKILYQYVNGSNSTIRIMDVDGSNDRELTPNTNRCKLGQWSPDGTKIIYHRETGYWQGSIYIINSDGTKNQPFLNPFPPYTGVYPWDWNCDKIVFQASYSHSGNNRLFIVNDDGSNKYQLTTRHSSTGHISPDCKKIVYYSSSSGIRIADIDGSNDNLLYAKYLGRGMSLSPDGNKLAFVALESASSPTNQTNIFLINLDGTNQIQLTNTNDIYDVDDWVRWKKKIIQIALDIKPGSYPNPLNVKSKGVLPVAILGAQDFAVNDINISSIELEGVAPTRYSFEDVGTSDIDLENPCHATTQGADGFMDLSLKFDTQEIVSALGVVEDGEEIVFTVTGELNDGTPIKGNDCVVILVKGKLKKQVANNTDLTSASFNLSQNYPNPFNPSTTISYSIPTDCNVTLEVYNYQGQKIDELIAGMKSAGFYETRWNTNVASGVYFYRIEAIPADNSKDSFVEIKKMILTR
ncbi:PD40 domain-containing protein [candidate division KSB1 bacterium]|nr:PD40 domain-containing protein [candidate division KSB1 bacterium]